MDYSIEPCKVSGLSGLVSHFFTIKIPTPSEEIMRMIPSGRHYILFFISGSAEIFHPDVYLKFENCVAIGGPRSHCLSYNAAADTYLLGVSLVSNGLYKLYGKDFSQLKSIYEESHKFLQSHELNEVLRLVQSTADVTEQVAYVESYLSKKSDHLFQDELVDQAIEVINENKGSVKVADLAKQLFVSKRHFEKSFARSVGVTPGKFARMIRFKYAFEEYSQKNLPPNELIMKYNYVDYSHFLKDFKQYTGELPKDIEVADTSLYRAYLKALEENNLKN